MKSLLLDNSSLCAIHRVLQKHSHRHWANTSWDWRQVTSDLAHLCKINITDKPVPRLPGRVVNRVRPNIDNRSTWLDPVPFDLETKKATVTQWTMGDEFQDTASCCKNWEFVAVELRTIIACPAAAMTMSASRTMLSGSGVRECTIWYCRICLQKEQGYW